MAFLNNSRSLFSDYLQQFPFWIMDVGPTKGIELGVFTPLFGFASIVAPEINIETVEIREGNAAFPTHVVKNASISPMTLVQGSTFFNSDFWRWTQFALHGEPSASVLGVNPTTGSHLTYRRNFILVHFFSSNPLLTLSQKPSTAASALGGAASIAATAGAIGLAAGPNAGGNAAIAAGLTAGASAGLSALGIGPFEFAARFPAKMWSLKGCIPTRYKTTSDFDANSSEISLMEIDIQPELIEEIALASGTS